jgi:hypothetical protein
MSNSIITQGEYNALVKIWNRSPSCKPKGVRWETLWNLQAKAMLDYERGEYGVERWWLTDAGKQAMDEYPHLDRIAAVNWVVGEGEQ